MVDAIATPVPSLAQHGNCVLVPWAAARERYAALCEAALHAPHQSPHWLDAWHQATGADMAVLFIGDGFALPLQFVSGRLLKTARLPGGSHANGAFAPFDPALGDGPSGQLIADALRRVRPDVDVLVLERLEVDFCKTANPLLAMRTGDSPNRALAVDLAGGFEALLARTSGKRKKKKHRGQLRRFEEAGGWRRIAATSPHEVDRLVSAYQEMKAAQFSRMGVRDPFAGTAMAAFLRAAYDGSDGFLLHGLEVGGRLRAVSGSTITSDRITCDFCAMADDDLAAASPGDFLFFENIAEACADGRTVYDFSVGDQPYKRHWCDLERRQFDVFLPLTLRGMLAARPLRARAGAKRLVKENRLLWAAAQRLRRLAAGQPAETTASDD